MDSCPKLSMDNFPGDFNRGAPDEDDLNECQLGLPHVKPLIQLPYRRMIRCKNQESMGAEEQYVP